MNITRHPYRRAVPIVAACAIGASLLVATPAHAAADPDAPVVTSLATGHEMGTAWSYGTQLTIDASETLSGTTLEYRIDRRTPGGEWVEGAWTSGFHPDEANIWLGRPDGVWSPNQLVIEREADTTFQGVDGVFRVTYRAIRGGVEVTRSDWEERIDTTRPRIELEWPSAQAPRFQRGEEHIAAFECVDVAQKRNPFSIPSGIGECSAEVWRADEAGDWDFEPIAVVTPGDPLPTADGGQFVLLHSVLDRTYLNGAGGLSDADPIEASYYVNDERAASTIAAATPLPTKAPNNTAATLDFAVTSEAGVVDDGIVRVFEDVITDEGDFERRTVGEAKVADGRARVSVRGLELGTHSLTVAFSGSEYFRDAAIDQAHELEIVKATPTVTARASALRAKKAGKVAVRVAVTNLDVTGTVTVSRGSVKLGTGTLKNGASTVAIKGLSKGKHKLTVSYGGNEEIAARSTTIVVTVR